MRANRVYCSLCVLCISNKYAKTDKSAKTGKIVIHVCRMVGTCCSKMGIVRLVVVLMIRISSWFYLLDSSVASAAGRSPAFRKELLSDAGPCKLCVRY